MELLDEKHCLDILMRFYNPHGIYCDRCHKITKHGPLKARPAYACYDCGKQYFPAAGTIFAKSETPFQVWFYIILALQLRPDVSIIELQRELGMTYKTAHRIVHEIQPDRPRYKFVTGDAYWKGRNDKERRVNKLDEPKPEGQ